MECGNRLERVSVKNIDLHELVVEAESKKDAVIDGTSSALKRRVSLSVRRSNPRHS